MSAATVWSVDYECEGGAMWCRALHLASGEWAPVCRVTFTGGQERCKAFTQAELDGELERRSVASRRALLRCLSGLRWGTVPTARPWSRSVEQVCRREARLNRGQQ